MMMAPYRQARSSLFGVVSRDVLIGAMRHGSHGLGLWSVHISQRPDREWSSSKKRYGRRPANSYAAS